MELYFLRMRERFGACAVMATALLAVLLVVSCDDGETPAPGAGSGTGAALSSLRRLDGDAAEAPAAASAGLALGLDIFQQLPSDQNRLISPYSIQMALAMTKVGARGQTLEEMDAVLHTGIIEDYNAALNALDQAVASRAGEVKFGRPEDGDPSVIELGTANALWGQSGFPFEQDFLDTLAESFGAGMNLLDNVNATEEARERINGWVSEQTAERIPELIKPDVLIVDTWLVLTNAVYLNAPWLFPFDPDDTQLAAFHLLDGSTVQVDMIHRSLRTGFASTTDYDVVRLYYAGRALSMLVIVSHEGRFADVARTLTADEIGGVVGSLGDLQVTLAMPKFEYRSPNGLSEILKQIGMPTAFDEHSADFSGMTTAAELYISDVVHESFISVDEAGIEAAASTAAVTSVVSAPPPATLTIDRPFLFLIRDNDTGAALFLGSVVDPTAGR